MSCIANYGLVDISDSGGKVTVWGKGLLFVNFKRSVVKLAFFSSYVEAVLVNKKQNKVKQNKKYKTKPQIITLLTSLICKLFQNQKLMKKVPKIPS